MIRSFRHKGLAELWAAGRSAKVDARLNKRLLTRLGNLDAANAPEEMNLQGYNFHGLLGFDPPRYTIHINGPWCVTFAFENGNAIAVDLEQYH